VRNNRQCFDEKISWVVFIWALETLAFKKSMSAQLIAYVCQFALSQEADLVEHLKNFTGRLMNGANDRLAVPG